MDRRAFLTLAGTTVGVAGCSAPLRGGENDSGSGGKLLYSGADAPTIQPGNYVPYRFSLSLPATLSYTVTVTEGPNIDVIATTAEHAEGFVAGEQWQFFSPASEPDTADATVEAVLEPEDWVLIVDNSSEGKAEPWPETPTPTGTPPAWRSGDATPTPTPEGHPASVQFEYEVRSGGESPTAQGPNGTSDGNGT